MGFVDHGPAGTGEPVAVLLRPGNAGSNTAADHISVVKQALAQLPDTVTSVGRYRVGRKVLIRADGGGGTHQFLDYLTLRHLSYSIGFGLTDKLAAAVDLVPESAWIAAIDDDTGRVRDGAWVTELTDLVDLSSWPAGIRLIIRAERPHPGAQLTFTDRDGIRLTLRSSPTAAARSKRLELRHRRRARCEDRIRALKDTGLRNLPLHRFDQNRIWAAIAALDSTLITWTQTLALTSHDARRWEPKKLRHRLLRPPNPTAPGRDRPRHRCSPRRTEPPGPITSPDMTHSTSLTERSRNTPRDSGTRRHPTQHRVATPCPQSRTGPENADPKPIRTGRPPHERPRLERLEYSIRSAVVN